MNISEAKAVAGLPTAVRVAGAQAVTAALAQVKRLMIEARKAGDDARAAELSEAKQVFKGMLKTSCPVCGVPIARGAKACALHGRLKPKALPLSSLLHPPPASKAQRPGRIDVSPTGGWVARYGYYAAAVQRVARTWRGKIHEERLQLCFARVAEMMLGTQRQLSLATIPRKEWPCVFDFGAALARVLDDKAKPEAWLIQSWWRRQEDWPEAAERIRQQGGKFSANTLNQAARRLRLLTPKPTQAAYRRATSGH